MKVPGVAEHQIHHLSIRRHVDSGLQEAEVAGGVGGSHAARHVTLRMVPPVPGATQPDLRAAPQHGGVGVIVHGDGLAGPGGDGVGVQHGALHLPPPPLCARPRQHPLVRPLGRQLHRLFFLFLRCPQQAGKLGFEGGCVQSTAHAAVEVGAPVVVPHALVAVRQHEVHRCNGAGQVHVHAPPLPVPRQPHLLRLFGGELGQGGMGNVLLPPPVIAPVRHHIPGAT
mmetsp:Transcript_3823/g.11022  ORF Transcript_3823/g.11022 Transcript_3823/m.11022 type:complete len:226 (-) Transcript_3823:1937-2614(-)